MTTSTSLPELVVLLDEDGQPIGTAPKATVHTASTPLHRAFSCYLFSPDGQLLLTRRAATKQTFPGLWTNSVCGHPAPGETDPAAIRRRAQQELGLQVTRLRPALPRFRYRASSAGITENEICPVYLGRTSGQPHPDPAETDQHSWTSWSEFRRRLTTQPQEFSPWSALQADQLEQADAVHRYLNEPSR